MAEYTGRLEISVSADSPEEAGKLIAELLKNPKNIRKKQRVLKIYSGSILKDFITKVPLGELGL